MFASVRMGECVLICSYLCMCVVRVNVCVTATFVHSSFQVIYIYKYEGGINLMHSFRLDEQELSWIIGDGNGNEIE